MKNFFFIFALHFKNKKNPSENTSMKDQLMNLKGSMTSLKPIPTNHPSLFRKNLFKLSFLASSEN